MGSGHGSQVSDLVSKIEVSGGAAAWQSVPSWLAFFLGLGEKVALVHEGGRRVAVIVVPPVRCFVAAAAATAAVIAVARRAEAVPDIEEHFAVLARLPLGTALVVKMGERIYAGKFAGVVVDGQGPGIRVEYSGMTHYIPKQLCQRIQVGSGGRGRCPRHCGDRARRISKRSPRSLAGRLPRSSSPCLPWMSFWWDMSPCSRRS